MLQSMTKKVEEEGAKETELFDKFMCYCKNGGSDLGKSIEDAKTKIPELEAGIEGSVSKKSQLESDLKNHKADKDAANTAIAEATALRNKEEVTFKKDYSEAKAETASLSSALASLEGGLGASFVQTNAAAQLRKIVTAKDMEDSDREAVLSFLSGKQSSPGTEQIVGILKTMKEEMASGLSEAEATENEAKANYAELMTAKKKEVQAATKMTEEKLQRVGQLATEVETMKNELTDEQDCLAEDTKMLATLKKSCATKEGEHKKSQEVRQEELVALADTIKILNDDDTLELMKKTLPSGSSSFMQIQVSARMVRSRALEMLHRHPHGSMQLDFIALALRGKKVGFEGVIKMIGELVNTLKAEQDADDKKKAYCADEFDKSADKKKSLERRISDSKSALSKAKEDIASLGEALGKLSAGIKALDASVAEATAQRKEEHAEYSSLMASDGSAKEVLKFAKNRLNKFYNPAQYKPPAAASFMQVSAHNNKQQSSGVIGMIDILIADLDKEMTEAEVTEKDSQGDYEQAMKDAQSKRATDSKALAESESEKADLEASLEELAATKKSAKKELMATEKYIAALHSDCDFLLQYFDVRKEARDSELDSLNKATSVLNGADYSFLQVGSTRAVGFLERA